MKKSNNDLFYGLKCFWKDVLEEFSKPDSKGDARWIGCLTPIIWIVGMILIIKLDGCLDSYNYDDRYDRYDRYR